MCGLTLCIIPCNSFHWEDIELETSITTGVKKKILHEEIPKNPSFVNTYNKQST